ncbi:MAG: DUF2339 domain-containing protein, partial [Pseudorhodoplanes sp.]
MFELLSLLGLAGFVLAWRMRGRLRLVETRLADLERRIAPDAFAAATPGVSAPTAPAAPAATPVPPAPEPVRETAPKPAAAKPAATPPAPAADDPAPSFEARFGTCWS